MKYFKFIFIFVLACTLAVSFTFAQAGDNATKTTEKGSEDSMKALYVGQNFSYDRGNRRDPFKSLMVGKELDLELGKIRGDGPAGCLVQELELLGIIKTSEGPKALVIACDEKGYQIAAGSKLFNGEVLSVDFEGRCVVFRQEVKDPLAIKPYTDVSKCLSLEENTK